MPVDEGRRFSVDRDNRLAARVGVTVLVPVAARQWMPAGTIDVWIQDRGEWYRRVCDDTERVRWYPADDLRRAERPADEKAAS